MKAFRSKLQTLHTVRQQRETQALERYAVSLRCRDESRVALRQIDLEWEDLAQRWRQVLATGCHIADLQRLEGHSAGLVQKRRQLEQELAEKERDVEKTLETMLRHRRDRETIQKFISKEKQEHELEILRQEQKILDEMGSRSTGGLKWRAAR